MSELEPTDQVTFAAVEVPSVQCPACPKVLLAPGNVLPEHSTAEDTRCVASGVMIAGSGQ